MRIADGFTDEQLLHETFEKHLLLVGEANTARGRTREQDFECVLLLLLLSSSSSRRVLPRLAMFCFVLWCFSIVRLEVHYPCCYSCLYSCCDFSLSLSPSLSLRDRERHRERVSLSLYISTSLSLSLSIYLYIYISLSLSLSRTRALPPFLSVSLYRSSACSLIVLLQHTVESLSRERPMSVCTARRVVL